MKEDEMNKIMQYSPIEFYKYIKENIKYGFVDKYMNKYYAEDFENVDIDKLYILQTPMQVVQNKCAWCWDVVELIRYYMECNAISAETYYLEYKDDIMKHHNTHTFIIYSSENSWYNIEDNSSNNEDGVHKYISKEEAVKNISSSFQDWIKDMYSLNELGSKYVCNKYEKPKFGISAIEFQNWCKKVENH